MIKTYSCKKCGKQYKAYESSNRRYCSKSCGLSCRIYKDGERSREKNGSWKGGKYKNQGYIYVLNPTHPFCKKNGYIAEHRLVIEGYIGRFISSIECIHHINHIRTDNRIENLMLLDSKKTHNRIDHNIRVNKNCIIFDGSIIKRRVINAV